MEPNLADDLNKQFRYNAACCALLVTIAKKQDRAKFRDQALQWLRADLAAYRKVLRTRPTKASAIHDRMEHWQQDNDLAGVREAKSLADLPKTEQQSWQKLWSDVAALHKQTSTLR